MFRILWPPRLDPFRRESFCAAQASRRFIFSWAWVREAPNSSFPGSTEAQQQIDKSHTDTSQSSSEATLMRQARCCQRPRAGYCIPSHTDKSSPLLPRHGITASSWSPITLSNDEEPFLSPMQNAGQIYCLAHVQLFLLAS